EDAALLRDLLNPRGASRERELAAVKARLSRRLVEKGLTPAEVESYATDSANLGKTLLQQVMEASRATLAGKLEAYRRHGEEHRLLARGFAVARGNSKAIASQYTYRIDPADNARRRANVHHTGSHYVMQQASSMRHGRTQGLMARHSSQGARLQARRMEARATAKVHGGGAAGTKAGGKTGKKSNMKRQGDAGGSKKTGGGKGGGGGGET
ncbi:hypothetical protein TeGR_g11789, partial [Tetraparma gracilis]